ncbi:MAG: hypothetical protein P8Z31_00600 [Gammaproteobacteria bacterium]|jgi:hypothetical protein
MPSRKTVFILALALLLAACEGPSLTSTAHTRPELTEAQRQQFGQYLARAQSDATRGQRFDKADYVRYEMPDGDEHIYMTKSSHPAHPAVVRRIIIKRLGIEKLATRGAHGGSQKAFEQWLAEFKALDMNRPRDAGPRPIPAL